MKQCIAVLITATAFLSSCWAFTWDDVTPLDEYVQRKDDVFSWNLLTEYRFDDDNCTTYILNMTSHRWMDETFSSRPIWTHYVGVSIPDTPKRNFAYMYIDGGGITSGIPGREDGRVNITRQIAHYTGYFGAFVLQVPNQGVVFANDPDQVSRTEDRFIAWTWKTFMETDNPNPEMVARFPMTKAGVQALDCINQFVLSRRPQNNITQFGVGGGSKRGWTAWSVAATDRRVIAVTPMVMSLLNFESTLQAHYRNLGGWTWVFNDYWELNLTQHFHDEKAINHVDGLWNYEDMFRYRERLALIPKLLVSGTGDEFFLVTDSHNWWNQMGGPKWILMNQNAEHSLVPWHRKIGETVGAWLMLLLEDNLPNVPQMAWLRGPSVTGGRIALNVDPVPDEITAWTAHTWRDDIKKDFRLVIGQPPTPNPVFWTRKAVTHVGPGSYDVEVPTELPGYNAVFMDCSWTSLIPGLTLHLTTEVQVTPDTFPFEGCYGSDCWGTLV